MRVCLGLVMAVVLGFVGTLRAAPVDLKQVDGNAKWVVHVDLDAGRGSTVLMNAYQFLLEKHPEAEIILAKVREDGKFDPGDLHGITFYGDQFQKEQGVAIVNAKVDEQVLLEKVKNALDHRVSTYGKHELHTWTHAKGSRHERSMTGTFFKPDLLVFGSSADQVMAALDVLDGTKPNVADQTASLAGAIPDGTVVFVGARDLTALNLPPHLPLAHVAKQVDSLVLTLGENAGKASLQATLNVQQPDVAELLKSVVEGFARPPRCRVTRIPRLERSLMR